MKVGNIGVAIFLTQLRGFELAIIHRDNQKQGARTLMPQCITKGSVTFVLKAWACVFGTGALFPLP